MSDERRLGWPDLVPADHPWRGPLMSLTRARDEARCERDQLHSELVDKRAALRDRNAELTACHERIDALRAENERLRESLRKVRNHPLGHPAETAVSMRNIAMWALNEEPQS